MRLITLMNRYIVMPAGQTTIVGYSLPDKDGSMRIVWDYDDEEYRVHCQDQDVELNKDLRGHFTITDDEGDHVRFIAYSEADLSFSE